MTLPARYKQLREQLIDEVSFGCGGLKLLSADDVEIGRGQVGYSVAPDGTSLCTGDNGAWQSRWLVIGYETGSGNPLFIDMDNPDSPVFTAMHGEGAWEPLPVAASIETFATCLEEFSRISVGRSDPLQREANPLGDEERKSFLDRVAQLNNSSTPPDFWNAILEF